MAGQRQHQPDHRAANQEDEVHRHTSTTNAAARDARPAYGTARAVLASPSFGANDRTTCVGAPPGDRRGDVRWPPCCQPASPTGAPRRFARHRRWRAETRALHQPLGELHREPALDRVDQHLLHSRTPQYPPSSCAVRSSSTADTIIRSRSPLATNSDTTRSTTRWSTSMRATASGNGPARTASTALSASDSNTPPAEAVTPPTPDRTARPTCDDRTKARAGARTIRAGAAPIRPTLEGFSAAPSRSFSDIGSPETLASDLAIRMVGRVKRWS